MFGAGLRRSELEALAAELARRSRLSDIPAREELHATSEPGEAEPAAGQFESILDELRDLLEDGFSEAKEATAGHPVASIAAAFLLGVIVGRFWRA